MHCARRVASRLAILVLVLGCACVALVPDASARGGESRRLSERELDRVVEREMKAQDRQIRSAETQGRTLDGLIRRYTQRALDENTGLAHFLHGRILAVAAMKQKDPAAAMAALPASLEPLQTATRLQPGFHQAHYRLAVVHIFQAKQAATKAAADAHRRAAEPAILEARRLRPEETSYILTHAVEILAPKGDSQGVKRAAETVLRIDSENDTARELLARSYMALEDYARAQRVVATLVRKNPQAIPLRVWWVECSLLQEKWDEAIGELKTLLAAVPKDPTFQQMLLRAYMGKGDAPAARKLLEQRLEQAPKDTGVRLALVEVLLAMRDLEGARREAERVLRDLPTETTEQQAQVVRAQRLRALGMLIFSLDSIARPLAQKAAKEEDEVAMRRAKSLFNEVLRRIEEIDRLSGGRLAVPLLDSAQVTLAILGRHPERVPYLERMIALLDDEPEAQAKLREVLADVKAGKTAQQPAETHPIVALMRRCVDPDPVVRRAALHEYYELNLPFVDAAIYRRHDHRIEPDALCRLWVVKILSRFESGTADAEIVRIAARYTGLALEDPASMVRREAAQGLGKIGAPAGLIYLLPHLAAMELETLPKTESEREDLEREYNATRMALGQLTGRIDYEIGDDSWIELQDAADNREGWQRWLDTKDGVAKRLEGMADLGEVRDVDPRWQLRYILADVIAVEPPAPAPVALAAYKVLRDRIQALPEAERRADPWWKTFPIYPDAEVDESTLPKLRSELKGWWNSARPRRK